MIPRYLFHYTSIDTAKKILQSHKIRFSRLDSLNDPYEGDFSLPGIEVSQSEKRKLIYCSCWSGDEHESINLWHIYTNMSGVRLKMKASMFSTKMTLEEQPSGFVPLNEITPISISCGILNNEVKKIHGPFKVSYVNSFEDTYGTAIGTSIANPGTDKEFEMYDVNLKELGIKKVKHWEYENEWRYKISPCIELYGSRSAMEALLEIDTPRFIDVPYIGEFEEILLAPQVSEEDKNELYQFLCDNGINIPLKTSCIRYQNPKK